MKRIAAALVIAAGCGTGSPPPAARPTPLGQGTTTPGATSRSDGATRELEKGTGAPDGNSDTGGEAGGEADRPTSEVRSDFLPCEPVVEDHAPGNRDRYRFEDASSGLVGFKNKAGTVVIAPTFRYASEFGPGGISSAVDGTTPFVFIDTAGKVIAKAYAFDNGPDYFQDGFARIVDGRGKIGFIDTRGRIVIAPQYDDAASFCHGKTEVAVGAKTFVIDHAGKTVAP